MELRRLIIPDSPLMRAVTEACAAWNTRAWLVGGALRDALLGRPIHDIDIAVEHDAIEAAREAASHLNAPMYLLDAERDTARVVTFSPPGTRVFLDFARLRAATLEDDLSRRDFTINAMAADLSHLDRLIDPFGGQRDLQAGLLREVTDHALSDDPIRLLRAVRLSAKLHMGIEHQTAQRIRRTAQLIHNGSAERMRDELAQLVELPGLHDSLLRLDQLNLLAEVLPEIVSMRGVTQSPPHHWDVLDHTLHLIGVLEMLLSRLVGIESQARTTPAAATALDPVWEELDRSIGPMRPALREHLDKILSDERPAWSMLKWAAMFHDISKPATRSVDPDGRIRFFEHEDVGATVAAQRMQRLRFSTIEINRVMAIIRHHMRPHHLLESGMSRRAAYRFFRDTGEAGVDVLLLSLADHLATYGPDLDPDRWARRLDLARAMLDEYFHRHAETVSPPALITGHDVMAALKLKPGWKVGEILEAVREAQAAGEVRTPEEALDMARTLSDERRTTKVE